MKRKFHGLTLLLWIILCGSCMAFVGIFAATPDSAGSQPESNDTDAFCRRGIAFCKAKEWERAIAELDEAIRRDLTGSVATIAYDWRGCAHLAKGDLGPAINDLTEAIRLNPTNATALLNRSSAYGQKLAFAEAIEDITQYLKFNPTNAVALALRAQYNCQIGNYETAIHDYDQAIRLDPMSDRAYNGLGWLRATCLAAEFRDGKAAVQAATKACKLTKWTQWQCVNTLAAASAESGAFAEATKYQKQAMAMGGANNKKIEEMQKRLLLYQSDKPYREPLAKPNVLK